MSIQHHSSISTSRINGQDLTARHCPIPTSSPHGIAGIPTSIQSRMLANASGGGIYADICSWLTNLFSKICQLLSPLFGSSSSNAISSISSLENVISRANQIIDSHFNMDFITNPANQQHSAIVTILKFNGHMEMSCGLTSDERNNVEGIKTLMRQLLSRGDISSDGRVDIETFLIKRNTDNITWDYSHEDSHFHSVNLYSRCGSDSGSSPMEDLPSILRGLQNRISNDRAAGARIGAVIRQLQSSISSSSF
jgi:hypothetical protein